MILAWVIQANSNLTCKYQETHIKVATIAIRILKFKLLEATFGCVLKGTLALRDFLQEADGNMLEIDHMHLDRHFCHFWPLTASSK